MKQQRLSAARQTEIAARQSDLHVDNGVYICPQAWFLARCDIPVDDQARLRLEAGTRAHRRIGRRTDLLRAAEKIEVVLLVVMAVLAACAAFVAIRGAL